MLRLLFILFLLPFFSFSQYSFNKGYDNIEIRGNITTYYKYRWYPSDDELTSDKINKNLFKLKDVRLKIEGSSNKRDINYEIHFDFAKSVNGEIPILDAYVTYNKFIETTIGLHKLNFSRHSRIAIIYSPWLKRAQIIDKGQTRRDVGLHLSKGFLNDKIQLFGSVVNGEPSLVSENDIKGGVEYIGRLELSYPCKMKYRAIDVSTSPIPVFSFGTSYRHSQKGSNDFMEGEDEIFTKINGVKRFYQADFALMYRGFSFLSEFHLIDYHWDQTMNLSQEKWSTSGVILEGNYFLKKYNSVFALRYDNTDVNFYNVDSQNGSGGDITETLSIGYNYRINSHLNVLKIQFRKEINGGTSAGDPAKYEIRVGLQYLIG